MTDASVRVAGKAALPLAGAVAWSRSGKVRVLTVVEGYIVARDHGAAPRVMRSEEWSRLRPDEWTAADRLEDDLFQLLAFLRLGKKANPTAELTEDGWRVFYSGPNIRPRWTKWERKPIEYVRRP